jgi:ABC-type multidrug transport system fused ATPase/permease subunit
MIKLLGLDTNKIKTFVDKKNYNYLYIYYFLLVGVNFLEIIGISSIPFFILSLTENNISVDYFQFLNLNSLLSKTNMRLEIFFGLLIFVIFLIKNIYIIFLSYYHNKLRLVLRKNLKNKIFQNYIYSPYQFFLNRNPASLARNVYLDCNNAVEVILKLILFFKEILLLIFIAILLLIVNPVSSLAIMLILLITSLTFIYITKNIMLKTGKNIHTASGSTLIYLQETFGSIKELKILNRHFFSSKRFNKAMKIEEQNRATSGFIQSLPRTFLELVSVTGIVILIIFLIKQKGTFDLILPSLTLFVVGMARMIPAYNAITQSVSAIKNLRFSYDFIFEELQSFERNNKIFLKGKEKNDFPPLKNKIIINNLNFSYQNEKKILKDINLEIKKNTKVGIVGPSGSGKSTLIDLITGLHSPEKGSILCDGINIDTNKFGWQKKLGYVPQNIYLLDDTIKSNVAFGIEEHEINEKLIFESLEKSQLKEFVESLP